MKKHAGQENIFTGSLRVVFWMSLIFTAGYGWYYAKHQIPEHFSVAEGEETSFSLDLPLYTTLLSESEEVVLKGDSGIPQDEITHPARSDIFSVCQKEWQLSPGTEAVRYHSI
ncbi:MAG: hypothetical protein ACLUD2_04225 [Clostridium sp.]